MWTILQCTCLNDEIFHGMLSIPQNIVMDLNNVMYHPNTSIQVKIVIELPTLPNIKQPCKATYDKKKFKRKLAS